MAKRPAENQMNQDNWDEEDENREVDPGKFEKASEERLQNRVIKKAKRRTTSSGDTSSPFATFSGFNTQPAAQPTFSFLTKTGSSSTNGDSPAEFAAKSGLSCTKVEKPQGKQLRNPEYFALLKNLNESVLEWVHKYMDKSPYCDFTPVFKDYEKYVQDLDKQFPEEKNSENSENSSKKVVPSKVTTTTESSVSVPKTNSSSFTLAFGAKTTMTGPLFGPGPSSTTSPAGFTFGLKSTAAESESSKAPNVSKPFSFGIPTTGQTPSPGTFSFAAEASKIKNREVEEDKENAEDENYEPPKSTFTPVEESDAVYSKRCKLFYKKEDSYVEKGVGMLHIKPLDGKTQLLIRADTSIGNILLNILLTSSIPISRTGKNNVLIICVPNPPVEPPKDGSSSPGSASKTVSMLVRVKTSEEADELFEKLNEHKC